MLNFEPVRVGVLGLGHISDVYLRMIARSPALALVGVASTQAEHSRVVAERLGCATFDPAAMIACDEINVVLDLAPAAAHDEVNQAIIGGGKHLYTEKPLALGKAHAVRLAEMARAAGVKVASAPDTFFGATHQKARALLDSGAIGTPVFGTAFLGRAGTEYLLPDPEAFYRPGGELPFDIGPYYVVQWINLLGPIRRVSASASGTGAARTIRIGPRTGQSFPVEIPTTYNCLLEFERTTVVLTLSLDVVRHGRRHMELYGEKGVLGLANPDFFGGDILLSTDSGDDVISVDDLPLGASNRLSKLGQPIADYRGIGLVDLAVAIRTGSEPRASIALAVHVAEVLEAIRDSALSGEAVGISSKCERPVPIGQGEGDDLLLRLAASPFDG